MWSPDGTRIAFTNGYWFYNTYHPSSIWLVEVDGNEITQMPFTDANNSEFEPAWSPDGTKIAFATLNQDDASDIYVVDTEGGTERARVTYTVEDAFAYEPQWSPDGTQIAFTLEEDGNRNIIVVDSDGCGLMRVTHTEGEDSAWTPRWSPDGTRIAFTNAVNGTRDIYVVDPDGSDLIQITRTAGDARTWKPEWSPDGAAIAFVSGTEGAEEIYVADVSGLGVGPARTQGAVPYPTATPEPTHTFELTQIARTETGDEAWDPIWSPDGSKIAFRSDRDGNYDVYTINPDGSELKQVTNIEGERGDGAYGTYWARWAPDGSKIIAFISAGGRTTEGIIVNLDGTQTESFVPLDSDDDAWDVTRYWSSDGTIEGTKVAFTSERDGTRDLYVAKLGGTEPTQITRTEGDDSAADPQWSPDGTKIAFVSLLRSPFDFAIYVVNEDGSEPTRISPYGEIALHQTVRWSPGGTKIMFNSQEPGSFSRENTPPMYVTNADGGGWPMLITDGFDRHALHSFKWSPDGSRIAFVSDRDGTDDVYVVKPDGSGLTQLTCTKGTDSARDPLWAPDGTWIAFTSSGDIFIVKSDGSKLAQVTHTAFTGDSWGTEGPMWSPDGTKIAFTISNRDDTSDLYVVDVSSLTR